MDRSSIAQIDDALYKKFSEIEDVDYSCPFCRAGKSLDEVTAQLSESMNAASVAKLQQLVNAVIKFPKSYMHHTPLDAAEYPEFRSKVAREVCLESIDSSLRAGKYDTVKDCIADFVQVGMHVVVRRIDFRRCLKTSGLHLAMTSWLSGAAARRRKRISSRSSRRCTRARTTCSLTASPMPTGSLV